MKKQAKILKKLNSLLREIKCPRFLHHFGPKKYKFVQHATALLLKEAFRLSFRRISNMLVLLEIKAPTYSALCKSRKRIPLWIWNSLLKLTARINNFNVAVDSTGFSLTNPSYYYTKRIDSKNPVKGYAKLSAFFDLRSKKFIALRIRAKPRHDINDVNYLLKQNNLMKKLFGDSAYDAESFHEKCFELKIQTIIKPRKNVKRGFYRRKQMRNYSEQEYHQRSLIESGFGSLKRKYGSFVFGRNFCSRRTEIYCKAICHNLSLRD